MPSALTKIMLKNLCLFCGQCIFTRLVLGNCRDSRHKYWHCLANTLHQSPTKTTQTNASVYNGKGASL